VRGRGGGIRLGMDATEIRIGDIFRMLEADSPVAECFADVDNTCPLAVACRLKSAITVAVNAFYASLNELTLKDLIEDNRSLEQILCLDLDFNCEGQQAAVA